MRKVLLTAIVAGVTSWLLGSWVSAAPTELSFDRLNQTYRDLAADIAPVSVGPATVLLSSPHHSLTLISHGLTLEPAEDGSHRFTGRATFLGKAELIALIETGSAPGRLEDEVLVPRQEIVVEGRAEVERQDDAYVIVPRELPENIEIHMQSRLGNQLISWCDMMSILLSSLDCVEFGASLSVATLPLPEPGESIRLDHAYLLPEEVRLIDQYLEGARLASVRRDAHAGGVVDDGLVLLDLEQEAMTLVGVEVEGLP